MLYITHGGTRCCGSFAKVQLDTTGVTAIIYATSTTARPGPKVPSIQPNSTTLINNAPSFGNYKTRRCYLNWEGTGFNIVAAWNGDLITELHILDYLYWKNPQQWIDKNKHYKIEELGLFDDNKETTNELVDFYN